MGLGCSGCYCVSDTAQVELNSERVSAPASGPAGVRALRAGQPLHPAPANAPPEPAPTPAPARPNCVLSQPHDLSSADACPIPMPTPTPHPSASASAAAPAAAAAAAADAADPTISATPTMSASPGTPPDTPPDTSHELHLRTAPLSVSQHLILGCSPLAGIYSAIPEEQAFDTVKAALDLGRGLNSSTSQLNLSGFCGIGGVRKVLCSTC